jgi:hypothetical protein
MLTYTLILLLRRLHDDDDDDDEVSSCLGNFLVSQVNKLLKAEQYIGLPI